MVVFFGLTSSSFSSSSLENRLSTFWKNPTDFGSAFSALASGTGGGVLGLIDFTAACSTGAAFLTAEGTSVSVSGVNS